MVKQVIEEVVEVPVNHVDHWFLCLELEEHRVENLQGVGQVVAIQLVGQRSQEAGDCLHLLRRVGGRILALIVLTLLAVKVLQRLPVCQQSVQKKKNPKTCEQKHIVDRTENRKGGGNGWLGVPFLHGRKQPVQTPGKHHVENRKRSVGDGGEYIVLELCLCVDTLLEKVQNIYQDVFHRRQAGSFSLSPHGLAFTRWGCFSTMLAHSFLSHLCLSFCLPESFTCTTFHPSTCDQTGCYAWCSGNKERWDGAIGKRPVEP